MFQLIEDPDIPAEETLDHGLGGLVLPTQMAMVAMRVTKRKEMMAIRLHVIADGSTDVDIIHAENQTIKLMIVALIDQEMKPNLTLNKKKSKTEDLLLLGEIDVDLDTSKTC